MAKQSGLNQRLLVGGYDISGDIQALDNVHGGPGLLDVTDITQSAHSRLGGQRDGSLGATAFMDAANAHPVLDVLPTADVAVSYLLGPTLGNPAACLVAKQIGYDPTRGTDGSLTLKTEFQANGFGLEWGLQLTPGVWSAASELTGQSSTFEGGVGSWIVAENCTIADSSAHAHTGSDSLAITCSGTSPSEAISNGTGTNGCAVVPGQSYLLQGWFFAGATPRTCYLEAKWYTSGGSVVSTTSVSTITDSTSVWTLCSGHLEAPATAAFALVIAVVQSGATSEVHYLDDVTFTPAPGVYNSGGSLSYGAQAYLQVTAFTGADATIAVYDSADDVSFSVVSGLSFTQITAAPFTQRLVISNTATVRQYIQAVVTTVGGFTALSAAVVLVKNQIAGQVF